jgi:multidrug efflux system membrane fusion protein
MHPLTVSFPLPERDLGLLRAAVENGGRGSSVRVALGEDGAVAAVAELTFIDSAVDTRSGTILAKAILRGGESFWPGQYVRVQVTLGTRPEAVAVPLVALQPGQDGSHVFVVQSDSTVMRRRVDSVETRGDEALIGQGLASGERVVVEGQSGIRDGSAVVERVSAASALPHATAEAGRLRR